MPQLGHFVLSFVFSKFIYLPQYSLGIKLPTISPII
ncbi:hypothetical protein HMPREF1231_0416, partial [Streptococcus pyogenes GA06023]